MLLFSFAVVSCNLFDTRDPENPITDNQSLPAATDERILMQNFLTAFQQKNIQEYEKLFADTIAHTRSFVFVPNQSAAARYSAVFTAWSKLSEVDYFRNITGSTTASSTPQITITYPVQPVKYQSDSVVYTIDYTLFVPHTRAGIIDQFAGRGELTMSPNKNNIWVIYRWIDYETKKDSSWSELKGLFSK
ncbi:MAG: hypothetical protein ACYC09_02740 [Bacteroidota bacterium]